MVVTEITDKKIWEDFLTSAKYKTFLNSWNWGTFYNSLGNKIWRFGIEKDGKLLCLFLVIKKEAKRGDHLFVPYGPVFNDKCEDIEEVMELFKVHLLELGKEEKCVYAKVSPIFKDSKKNEKLFKGFVKAPMFVHPEITWILDITLNEDKLLAGMRKTTRYMIRQAEKNDVVIIKSTDSKDIEKYNELYLKTVKRHDFIPFSKEYLESELNIFAKDSQAEIFFAKYKGEIISGAVVIFWQGCAYYHQGASDNSKFSKIGASYLLQWEVIKEAKKRGCKFYNFWGIVPGIKSIDDLNNPKIKKHPWYGLSLFKMGFNGKIVNYLPTYNLAITPMGWFSFLYEKLERIKKGI